MAAAVTRMNDEGYKNWLRVGQSLLVMCEGIHGLTTEVMDDFHKDLLKILGPQKCAQCKAKCEPQQNCNICTKWEKEILDEHANKKGVHWTNTDCKLWPALAWEVAKVFMPRGQKPSVKKASDTDSSALLNLMTTCKKFKKHVGKPANKVTDVTNVRNSTMHSTTMKFNTAEMTKHIQKILNLLNDQLSLAKRSDAKKAAKTIEEIRDGKFIITEENENNILTDQFAEFGRRLEELEGKITPELTEEIKKFEDFINGNADLKCKFSDDINTLQNRVGKLEKRVDHFENELEKLKNRPPVEPLPTMFKNHLNEYTQTQKLATPVYEAIPEESGHRSKVTVNGKTYLSKDVRTTKKDAEQDAAREALRALGKLTGEEPNGASGGGDGGSKNTLAIAGNPPGTAGIATNDTPPKTTPLDDTCNYKGVLQAYLQKNKHPVPEYRNNKISDTPPTFTARVTVIRGDKSKDFASECPQPSAKKAEQSAAKVAMLRLDIPLPEPKESKDDFSPKKPEVSPGKVDKLVAEPALKASASPPNKQNEENSVKILNEFIQGQKNLPNTPPKYDEKRVGEQSFTASVSFQTKYAIQTTEAFSSKKAAEESLAKQVLQELDKDVTGNCKSKLNELDPPNKPRYISKEIEGAAANRQYVSVIVFNKIEKVHTITVDGGEACKSKKLAKECAANNAMELFKNFKA